jgi:D-amino-acid dehydrogenase
MTGENAAVRFHLSADRHFLAWLLASLLQCRPAAYRANVAALKQLASESMASMADLARAIDKPFDYQSRGSLRLFARQAEFERAAASSRPSDVLTGDACFAVEPGLRHARVSLVGGILLRDDQSGDCRVFTLALAEKCQRLGVEFRYGSEVTKFAAERNTIASVVTDSGVERTDAVVHCAGAWSPFLVRSMGVRLPVIPIKGYALTVNIAEPVAAPRAAIMFEGRRISVTRLGGRIRAAGIAEFAGFNVDVDDVQIEKLRRCVDDLFPGAADWGTVTTWAGLRPATPSGLPFIGRTRISNLVLNTGHGPLGWTLAAGSAARVAALFR